MYNNTLLQIYRFMDSENYAYDLLYSLSNNVKITQWNGFIYC